MKIITKENKIEELTMWNFPQGNIQVTMSCLQDHINISYKELVKLFGKETSKGDDYKVQAEWHIITPSGIGTIYDYKMGKKYCGRDGISKTKVTDWHIGGENKETSDWIIRAISNNK